MRLLNLRINFFIYYGLFLSEVAVNHLKKARGEIWPKRSERRNKTKNYQEEDKKSAINKKKLILINELVTFLNEQELICLHTVKWFEVLIFNPNDLI